MSKYEILKENSLSHLKLALDLICNLLEFE
jgi:hypothetical protein